MVEQYRANRLNPELEWETQVIFDSVVKREYERHPKLNSRRKKLIFIQETFGIWNPTELGHLIGIDEKTTRKFLSRRGIRQSEYEEIKNQFDGAFAVTSMIEKQAQDSISRRVSFVSKVTGFGEKSLKALLISGEPEKAVFIAEKSYRHNYDE